MGSWESIATNSIPVPLFHTQFENNMILEVEIDGRIGILNASPIQTKQLSSRSATLFNLNLSLASLYQLRLPLFSQHLRTRCLILDSLQPPVVL